MCPGNIHQTNENHSEREEEEIREPPIPWPIETDRSTFIWSCNVCYYPIARFGDFFLIHEHGAVVAILLTIQQLITEDFAADSHRLLPHTWQRRVYCFNCGLMLSFGESTVPDQLREIGYGNNRVLLDFSCLRVGSTFAMRLRFIPH